MSARAWALGIAFVVFATQTTGWAADAEVSKLEQPPKLEVDVLPYAWVPGIYGSATIKGNTTKIDVTPSDLLNLLFDGNAFAAAGYLSLDYDRFFLFGDSMGGYAEARVNETIPTQLCNLTLRAKAKMKFVMADFGMGYRLGQWTLPNRKRPFTLGVYVGTRYMWFLSRLSATAGVVHGAERSANVSEDFAWADPMIGVRWSAPLLDWVALDFRGDIGGFGASSDLVWGLAGTFKVAIPWTPIESVQPYLALGYRVVAFDRSASAGNIDLQYRGPLVGLGFVF
jgi:hypothetical protein